MLHQLDLAQRGESEAMRQVLVYTWDVYGYRIHNFYSKDAAVDADDIRQVFGEGVLRGIREDKGLGDRLYYCGQRGWWAVAAETKRSMRFALQQKLSRPIDDWHDPVVSVPDPREPEDLLYIRHETAREQVQVLSDRVTGGTAAKALAIMFTGGAGDPSELGYMKKLAEALGVSPQRASQINNELRRILEEDAARNHRIEVRRSLS